VAASASYLLDLSPIKKVSRLAIGDLYTGGFDVMIFVVLLAALLLMFVRTSPYLARQKLA
jgi:hypothetical protein